MITKVCKGCGLEFETNRNSRLYCSLACSGAGVARKREDDKLEGQSVRVWSCGGGVQSTAIGALIIQGKLKKPDYAVMVDVGYEKTYTWEHLHGTLIPALKAVGVDLQVIRTTDYRGNELFDPQGHCILPAYRRQGDIISRLHTHCSGGWKMKVVMKWMRSLGVTKANGWIGISTDEARRIRTSGYKWYTLQYPLIRLGMDRLACQRTLWEQGWNDVRHSSCYICPQQNNEQWLYVAARYPEDWAKAVAIDEQLRERDPNLYLHRSAMPLPEWLEMQKANGYPAIGEGCEDVGACADCL